MSSSATLQDTNIETQFLSVAINVPLRRLFEYSFRLDSAIAPQIGMRVEVLFAGRVKIGIILKVSSKAQFDRNKIKPIQRLLEAFPIASPSLLAIYDWMQKYYHAPPGEIWQTLLPNKLLKGEDCQLKRSSVWRITSQGQEILQQNKLPKKAVQQHKILHLLNQTEQGIAHDSLKYFAISHSSMKSLAGKKYVEKTFTQTIISSKLQFQQQDLQLNTEQSEAIKSVCEKLDRYQSWLLFGVTASGKTEVYIRIIWQIIKQGKQALLLVPEIGLTPQTVKRFADRFNTKIELLHSAISDQQRLQVWLKAQSGEAKIIIGTRSALFVPMKHPGIIIIDEEHDLSFRQQQGFRYSARDIAMVRGHIESIPVLLGSATPSIETLANVDKGKIKQLSLRHKAMTAQQLKYRVIDLKNQSMRQGLSLELIQVIQHHLKQQGQVLLFLNRRGYSPVLLCHLCGWSSECKRCESHFTYHHASQYLQCHHCGSSRRAPDTCPQCSGQQMVPVGLGTERLEESVQQIFSHAKIRRIDRDTTRKKQAMDNYVEEIKSGEVDLLIGTQMLAKGHHFPKVTLVALVDMDGALYSSDFRAPEFAAQLITQVSGRAGRSDQQGEVVIQTHHIEHPMLSQIIQQGYSAFAKQCIAERKQTLLPPFSYHALFQAEAPQIPAVKQFLHEAKNILNQYHTTQVDLLGPVPSFYTKKAGKYRYQLFLESANRKQLHQLLAKSISQIEQLKSSTRVRWRLEVDPISD
ncbi:MAG: primosomal protein N' [Enterobacterales bacterium]|nr:primosomal protein N' [Enterobacterales bacterium]